MAALVSIDNFEAPAGSGGAARQLDSPRTLEACLLLGVDVEELYPQPLAVFVERAHGHQLHLARVMA